MTDGMAKRPAADWRVGLLRVTGFPAPDAVEEGRSFWGELGLAEAESHEKKKGQVTDQGPVLDHWLTITSAAGRIDWLYLPRPDLEEFEVFGFRDVGPFPEAIDKYVGLMEGWLERECPKLLRFALGATVWLPAKDRVDGYRQLSAYLPFKINGESSSDFQYQINRHRKSVLDPQLKINRLTQWSVSLLTRMGGQISLIPGGMPPVIRQYDSQSACQIVLDINSDPEYLQGFQETQLRDLFREFVQMAKEIVAEGDIP